MYSAASTRVDAEWFKRHSSYDIPNAFYSLDMGVNEYNIHGASMGEMLHMIQIGLLPYMIEGFYTFIGNDEEVERCSNKISSILSIDLLALQYGSLLHRQSETDHPRTKFSQHFSKGSKLSGHERQGVVLDLLLVSLSDRGRQILLRERTVDGCRLFDFVQLFEIMMGFEEFLKKKEIPMRAVRRIHKNMKALIHLFKMTVMRKTGMGHNLIKLHLLLHLADNIQMFGPPMQWNSGPSESHHITETKGIGRRTQQRSDTFVEQTCRRYTEVSIVRRAERGFGLSGPVVSPELDLSIFHGARYTVGYSSGGKCSIKWDLVSNSIWSHPPLDALKFLCEKVLHLLPVDSRAEGIHCSTLHKRSDGVQTYSFHAHPDFINGQPWYDWAYFQVHPTPLPGHIYSFITLPKLVNPSVEIGGYTVVEGSTYALTMLFKKAPDKKFRYMEVPVNMDREDVNDFDAPNETENLNLSDCVSWGELSNEYCLLDVDTIAGPACIVPNIPALPETELNRRATKKRKKEEKRRIDLVDPIGGYFVVSPRVDWSQLFTDMDVSI